MLLTQRQQHTHRQPRPRYRLDLILELAARVPFARSAHSEECAGSFPPTTCSQLTGIIYPSRRSGISLSRRTKFVEKDSHRLAAPMNAYQTVYGSVCVVFRNRISASFFKTEYLRLQSMWTQRRTDSAEKINPT